MRLFFLIIFLFSFDTLAITSTFRDSNNAEIMGLVNEVESSFNATCARNYRTDIKELPKLRSDADELKDFLSSSMSEFFFESAGAILTRELAAYYLGEIKSELEVYPEYVEEVVVATVTCSKAGASFALTVTYGLQREWMISSVVKSRSF